MAQPIDPYFAYDRLAAPKLQIKYQRKLNTPTTVRNAGTPDGLVVVSSGGVGGLGGEEGIFGK
jgi:hypothetical protein